MYLAVIWSGVLGGENRRVLYGWVGQVGCICVHLSWML